MSALNKVVRIGICPDGNVFAKIEVKDGKLSISGVIGPKSNGDCHGSCGQFIMSFKEYDERGHDSIASIQPAPGWDRESIKQFFDFWDRWHLNDTRAGSKVQEDWLRDHPIPQSEYEYPKSYYVVASKKLADAGLNPDPDGYKYGHAWKLEPLPDYVFVFLNSLPDTDIKPAWV